MKSNPKIGLQSNAHTSGVSIIFHRHFSVSHFSTPWKTVRTLNVAAKCSIAVSQDMPKWAECGISMRLLCVSPAKWRCWCRKCKQSQMEIQLLKRLVHCGIHQNLHISYLFVGLGAALKAAKKCQKCTFKYWDLFTVSANAHKHTHFKLLDNKCGSKIHKIYSPSCEIMIFKYIVYSSTKIASL